MRAFFGCGTNSGASRFKENVEALEGDEFEEPDSENSEDLDSCMRFSEDVASVIGLLKFLQNHAQVVVDQDHNNKLWCQLRRHI